MEDSILTSIKKMLGVTQECTDFDVDIIIHINTALSILTQLGVGPPEGFFIEDATTTWDDYINGDSSFNDVKTYIYLKVKTIFDPPQSSVIMAAYKETIKELEWRLNVTAETDPVSAPVTAQTLSNRKIEIPQPVPKPEPKPVTVRRYSTE